MDYHLVYYSHSLSDNILITYCVLQTSIKVNHGRVSALIVNTVTLVTNDHPNASHPFGGDVILSVTLCTPAYKNSNF